MSTCFPELVEEIAPIPHDFAVDGELVVRDNRSCPQWDRLTERLAQRSPVAIKRAAAADPAAIFEGLKQACAFESFRAISELPPKRRMVDARLRSYCGWSKLCGTR